MNKVIPVAGVLVLIAAIPGNAIARPVFVEETTRLDTPAGLTYLGESVAVDGNHALATALRSADGTYNYPYQQLALAYRRSANGQWAFEKILVDDDTDALSWNYPGVALRNGIAAVSVSPLFAFKLESDAWVPTPSPFPAPVGNADWANGQNLRIDGSTLLAGADRCHYGAVSSEWSGVAWSPVQSVHGNERICSLANYAGSLDLDGNTLALSNPQEDSDQLPTELRIYDRTAPGAPWQLTATLPTGEYQRPVAIRNDELFVGSWDERGNEIYRRENGAWHPAGFLPTLRGFGPNYNGAFQFAKSGEFILFAGPGIEDVGGDGIHVYRAGADGAYEHVATLLASNGEPLGGTIDISGRTVITSGIAAGRYEDRRLYFFELPEDLTSPEPVRDDFESGAAKWKARGTSRLGVVLAGATHVLRQSSVAGEGGAVLANSDWTAQSVQADIRPILFDGDDRWFGLATRLANESNYYYVTLRSSGSVQLKRKQNGAFTTLASRALPVNVNQTYRVRLESVGSRHRVFVDGVPVINVLDGALTHGRAALLTYRTSADFDDVVVSPGPQVNLFAQTFPSGSACGELLRDPLLRQSGTPQWDCSVYTNKFLRQASVDGVARAAIGPVTDDQSVEVRVMAEAFGTGGTQDKWFGVMTRYADPANYYYLSLRSSHHISLRKLVNGVITDLGTAAIKVVPGAWYALRLEAIGNEVRGFVNGKLVLEAHDGSHTQGISGVATYRTAARFDDWSVIQP